MIVAGVVDVFVVFDEVSNPHHDATHSETHSH